MPVPVGGFGSGTECTAARLYKPAIAIAQADVAQVMLPGVNVLDIADRKPGALDIRSHAFVTGTADAGGPFWGQRGAYAGLPISARARQVVGPQQRAAGRIASMHDGDVGIR